MFSGDTRGAVAFEMLYVFPAILLSLFFPMADVAFASFKYLSAWQALRAFGEYVQSNPPPDVTSLSSWTSSLQTTVGSYAISNINVLCGDTSAGAACTSSNVVSSPSKYFTFSTSITLTPTVLTSVLCTSANANPCTYTLSYAERLQ